MMIDEHGEILAKTIDFGWGSSVEHFACLKGGYHVKYGTRYVDGPPDGSELGSG